MTAGPGGRRRPSGPACPGRSGPHPGSLPLGEFGHSVGFLVSQIGAATARRFKEALAELAVDPRHFALMRAIEAAENLTQQLLAELLQIPASSMVALLDYLEERGLVARHHDPADRRVRVVELTAEGRELLRRATRVGMATEAALCAGLSAEEREWLIARLRRVAENLGLTSGVHPDLGAHLDLHGGAASRRRRGRDGGG